MLLSLLKIMFFFSVVLAAALGAMHLAETDQVLRVVFNGVEYTLRPLQTLALAVLVALAGWIAIQILRLFLAFIRFLAGDETAIDRYFARRRERKGYHALAEGMLAVASGEGRLAQDQARKAAKFLHQPHITNLLAAQAAEVAGDSRAAEDAYRTMLTDGRTRFVAVRGLMQQRLALGDNDTALRLAQKAYALRPGHSEVQDTLLTLQTRAHDWKGARGVLKDKRKQGSLPPDVHIRRDAVLALQEASEVLAQGNSISAREAAISANRASPDLVPAAVLAARSYLAKRDARNATRVLQKTWAAQPHPAIAAAYADIVPDETPAQRLRRFEDLIRQAPKHEESRLLQAELMLAVEDFPGARRALGDLARQHPTVRSLSIMAAIERGEGASDNVVRGWLARALSASRGPQWVCDKCHNVMTDWSPVCDSCGGFDTLSWREAPADVYAATSTGSSAMLPLLGISGDDADGAPTLPRPAATTPYRGGVPGMIDADDDAVETPRPTPEPAAPTAAPQVIRTIPGMVPRESDYEPSITVTDPELITPPAVEPHAPHGAGRPGGFGAAETGSHAADTLTGAPQDDRPILDAHPVAGSRAQQPDAPVSDAQRHAFPVSPAVSQAVSKAESDLDEFVRPDVEPYDKSVSNNRD